MSSFLHFIECQNDGRKTKVWMVRNNQGEDLGAVSFNTGWRRYTLHIKPSQYTTQFDAGCLEEIIVFLKLQTDSWKAGLRQ